MLQALGQARVFLTRRQKFGWLLLVPLSMSVAALEALAAGAVFFLIRWADDPVGTAATLPASLAAHLGSRGPESWVPFLALAVGGLFLVKNLLRLFEIWARQRRSEGAALSLARRMLRAYLAAPWSFHLQRGSDSLVHNILVASRRFSAHLLHPMTSIVSEALVVLGMLCILVFSTPGLALGMAAAAASLLLVLLLATQRTTARLGSRSHRAGADLVRVLQQGIGGVKELRLLGRTGFFEDSFAEHRLVLAKIEIAENTLNNAPRVVVETTFVTGMVAAVVGAHLSGGGDLLARVGLFAYAGMRIMPSLHWIVGHLNRVRFGAASLEPLREDWLALCSFLPASSTASEARPFRKQIEFRDVSFSYPGAAEPTLRDVSFCIRRGESIGIVGTTGAGKSTLLDLVLGLLQPDRGEIYLDDQPLAEHLEGWQRQIGYVPQSPYLVDDSIARNVALGLDDVEVDRERVQQVADVAQLEAFLASLPDGLDSLVGERGLRLSGGERQRLAVARALYHDPQVLVLDEATSALDSPTELALSRAVQALQGEKTLIIVAHRMSSVRHCDRLIVLSEGGIADMGSYDELLEKSPVFRSLANAA